MFEALFLPAATSAVSTAASASMVAQGLTTSLAVLGAVGKGVSILESQHAQDALEEAADAKEAIRLQESKRRERELRRQRRSATAEIQNRSAQAGVAGSSGAIGAVSSIQSQGRANEAFLDLTDQLAWQATSHNRSAARHSERAGVASTMAQMGMRYGDFGALV